MLKALVVLVWPVGIAVLLALTALTTRAQAPREAQPGFTLHLSLVDFMIVQRALMALPDEKAPGVLDDLRKQVLAQTK